MSTITVPRPDVTLDDINDALRRGLGSKYTVLPDTALNWNPLGRPRTDETDTIVVGTGSARLFRVEVRLARGAHRTSLHVSPGGLTPPLRLANRLWLVGKVTRLLQTTPGLHRETT